LPFLVFYAPVQKRTMPTFLDESGDIGPTEKSAPYFRIAAVWFEHDEHTEEYENAVKILRKEKLKLPDTFEFHFSGNSHRQKESFFETIANHPFIFFISSFDKQAVDRATLTKDTIRESTIEGLVGVLRDTYHIAEACKPGTAGLNERIIFDECNDRHYEHELKRQFGTLTSTRGPNEKLIRSIKPSRSRSDLRIQLVDMVCGAVRLHLEGDHTYFTAIKSKCMGILRIP